MNTCSKSTRYNQHFSMFANDSTENKKFPRATIDLFICQNGINKKFLSFSVQIITICPINRETSGGGTRKSIFALRASNCSGLSIFRFYPTKRKSAVNLVNLKQMISVLGHNNIHGAHGTTVE